MRQIIIPLLFFGCAAVCSAQSADLAMPHRQYLLRGVSDTLYSEAALRLYGRQAAELRWGGTCAFSERRPQRAVIVSAKDGDTLTADLVSTQTFDTLASSRSRLCVAEPGIGSGTVRVQILGDSYVQGAFYRHALLETDYVLGLRLIGLRAVAGVADQYDEGRGGWTVERYFEVRRDAAASPSPFMQPTGDRRYWGSTAFWRNAYKAQDATAAFEVRYACGRFEHCLPLFDAATGLLSHPTKGDMMWDSARDTFIIYTGRRWQPAADDSNVWTFDYAKYLHMWRLEAPQILFENLGLNDFRDSLSADYRLWDTRLMTMFRSYREAVPGGQFVIIIPCSSTGTPDNRRGDFVLRQNMAMWQLRRHIIDTYCGREAEGIHVLDMGIHIDNATGYRRDSHGLQTGNPHPYVAYPAMSVGIAACVQYIRKQLTTNK